MIFIYSTYNSFLLASSNALRPIAQLARSLTALLLLAWNGHAASSRLASQPTSYTLGRIQPRLQG